MNQRLDRITDELDRRELGGLLVSRPENRRYLSGFTGSAGNLLISPDQTILATDSRYTEQANDQAPDFRVVPAQSGWDWLVKALLKSGVNRLGFESEHLTVAEYQRILAAIKQESALANLSLVPASGIVEELRAVKEQQELARLQRAVEASDSAMDAVGPTLRAGLTEQEVAWRMEQAMRESGADSSSFNTIVASGPNGAMPHHRPTGRTLRPGEPVVIDLGAKVGGYCSDLARTLVLGQEDATFRRIYDIVLGAQLTALAIVRPGMTGGDCDRLARSVIRAAGYGDNFGHGLGHGVGLAVHEGPRLGPDSEDILAAGTVFTVEPGIYIPGWGGVRIEDLVLLEEGGARPLSKARK
jgi:Xaa-Pro aminopeptidase